MQIWFWYVTAETPDQYWPDDVTKTNSEKVVHIIVLLLDTHPVSPPDLTDKAMLYWGLAVLMKQYLQNITVFGHCVSLHLIDIT